MQSDPFRFFFTLVLEHILYLIPSQAFLTVKTAIWQGVQLTFFILLFECPQMLRQEHYLALFKFYNAAHMLNVCK